MVVDGGDFDVQERPGQPGQYDFEWVSGPNPAMAFSLLPRTDHGSTHCNWRTPSAPFSHRWIPRPATSTSGALSRARTGRIRLRF
jgi:hypothetical protein